ncbi:unnamed protein product [Malus baccata var. baccata]
MACMKLGIKSEAFHREGQTWLCTTGLPSDVVIQFPLLSKSGLLERLIEECSSEEGSAYALQLHGVPGGAKAFELVTKFCYGVKIELIALNVVILRYYEQGNLITQTEIFLTEVFSIWRDLIVALETCEEVQRYAEELHIASRCIDSLAIKAYADPKNPTTLWNGITSDEATPQPLRLIQVVELKGMRPESIAYSFIFCTRRYLPLMNRQSSLNDTNYANSGTTIFNISEADQKALLEDIKGVASSKFLRRLPRTAMILYASPSCRENLEKRVGAQITTHTYNPSIQTGFNILITNMGYSVGTLYDIDCIQRILDHFMSINQASLASSSPCIIEEGRSGGYHLAEVALNVNLKLPKFQSLAAVIPEYARPLDDGIYHAIDVFLKQLCRLMYCQKLSLEASTHAAQNERLPLRVIVKVLFFEQLRLRTSISGWFFVDNLENSQNPMDTAEDQTVGVDHHDMRKRVLELQKECSSMKKELQKRVKTKRSWSILPKRLGFRKKLEPCNPKESKPSDWISVPASCCNGQQTHENSEWLIQPQTLFLFNFCIYVPLFLGW